MKKWLPVILSVVCVACGGGGGGDSGDSPSGSPGGPGSSTGSVTIREPIIGNGTYSTSQPSVEISGTAFPSPDDVDCISVFPRSLSLTWDNASTGQSGSRGISTFCQDTFLGLQVVTAWVIPAGDINLQIGDNPISIVITDNQGKTGTGSITIQRIDDVLPPKIVGRSPAADAVDVPPNRSIVVTFNEPMLPTSLTGERLTLQDSTGLAINGFSSYDDDNFRWTFDPNADLAFSTTYTVTISADVEDEFGGNTLGTDESWSFTTGANPDVTPPQIIEVSPEPGTQCVAPNSKAAVRFDEAMDSSSIDTTSFTIAAVGASPVEATVRYDGVIAELEPLLPLVTGTDYEATVSSTVTDLAGNSLTDFSWSFRTSSTALVGDWQATSSIDAPFARRSHTATWTGSQVIVWGGYGFDSSAGGFVETNTGGRYDPATDMWSTMSTSGVSQFSKHTAVFTGTEMIVWGGNSDAGARYDPGTDSWQATSSVNAPGARSEHVAVWTGSEMIVWGGESIGGQTLNTGGRYDPSIDAWTSISVVNAPSPRRDMAVVWTGTEMIVWGGIESASGGAVYSDGARYNPATDTWTTLPVTTAGSGSTVVAAWTGVEMLVWNGGLPTFIDSNGFPVKETTLRAYDPVINSWRAPASACEPYLGAGKFYAHWTGSRLFALANGTDGAYFYDPVTDDWQAVTKTVATSGRSEAASIWAGDAFFLWGGQVPSGLQDSGFVFSE